MRAQQLMLDEIDRELRYTRQYIGRDHLSPAVHQTLLEVPRHAFVPDALQDAAYDNGPLPIGEGQTISQPYIVAIMTELLDIEPHFRVLEIGTGSGYQTAVLAELAEQVYSMEIIARLASRARARLKTLGYQNIEIHSGDGYVGWPEAAPFDAIMITASAPDIPQPLLDQLRPGGKLITPVDNGSEQELILFHKLPDETILTQKLLPVAFVPLTGQARDHSSLHR